MIAEKYLERGDTTSVGVCHTVFTSEMTNQTDVNATLALQVESLRNLMEGVSYPD